MKKSKKGLEVFVRLLLVVFVFVTNFGFVTNVYAEDPTSGTIKNATNSVGSTSEQGDVKLEKTISKTSNDNEYQVTLEVKGKDAISTTSTTVPIYTVIVFDRSGSMENYCSGGLTDIRSGKGSGESCNFSWRTLYPRWSNAVAGARSFAKTLNTRIPNAQIALVTFADSASTNRGFNNANLDGVNFGEPDGGTNIVAGLDRAKNLLNSVPSNAKKVVVLIGDGTPEVTGDLDDDINDTINKATTLKNAGIEIFTIGYAGMYSSETTSTLNDDAIYTLKNVATDASHLVMLKEVQILLQQ